MFEFVVFYLFVELVAGPQSVLDGVLVVGRMEVEEVDTICVKPLQGGLQLCAHALWPQGLAIPGIGLGGQAYCHTNPYRSADDRIH